MRNVLVLAAAGLLISSLVACESASGPSSVIFNGQRYTGLGTRGLQVSETDLREVGVASDISLAGPVTSNTVYSIQGVPPEEVIVMDADTQVPGVDTPYLLFVRTGIPSGMCPYWSDRSPEPEVCSPG